MNAIEWKERTRKYTLTDAASAFSINFAGMKFTDKDLEGMKDKFASAFSEMRKLEAGAIKNPDENRKVTHFTDRKEYATSALFNEVKAFAEALRKGEIKGSTGKKFEYAVINGIGGSALGPQLMQFAVNGPFWNELGSRKRKNYLKIYFLDNTDSSGLTDVLNVVKLESTIVANISKSGGTQETKNNMIACEAAFKSAGLDFTKHACAITMAGSELDKYARSNKWLQVFEMAESIGGRTSETSIVGQLPAAFAGIDFGSFLKGACKMDEWTRAEKYSENPAAMLAAMWYIAGEGKGNRNMVIVPYSDRLLLMSRYLQQLVMESLGKEKDLDGNLVYQGLNVFGNKGGTDAHAFIQQLNDGRDDFFATFIEPLQDASEFPISKGITMGDYLHGFMAGLSSALRSKGRQTIEISIKKVDAFNLGMLIALYERAVAIYAEFIHINAFHQPGVQAYKLASKDIISLQYKIEDYLEKNMPLEGTADEIATKGGFGDMAPQAEGILSKFAENNRSSLPYKVKRSFKKSTGWTFKVEKKG